MRLRSTRPAARANIGRTGVVLMTFKYYYTKPAWCPHTASILPLLSYPLEASTRHKRTVKRAWCCACSSFRLEAQIDSDHRQIPKSFSG